MDAAYKGKRKPSSMAIAIGVLFIAGAVINLAYFSVLRYGWLETPVVAALETSSSCREGEKGGAKMNAYDYVYQVDGKESTLKDYCAKPSQTLATISYDPTQPWEAVPGNVSVYYLLSAILTGLGAGFILMGYILKFRSRNKARRKS